MNQGRRQNREARLSGPVSAWLGGLGCTVYAEAPNHDTAVDLVGATDMMLVAVELKMTLSAKVRHSAYMNKLFAECSFVAVPTRPTARSLADCRAKGVGILEVRDGCVAVRLPASYGEMLFGGEQNAMRRKLGAMAPGGVGGLPCQRGMGPSQDVLRDVDAYLAEHPAARWALIWRDVPNHYSNARSMAQSLGNTRVRIMNRPKPKSREETAPPAGADGAR